MNWSRMAFGMGLLGFAAAAGAQGAGSTTLEGHLEPRKVVAVGAQVSGPVARVLVEEGETVSEGELLARIDPSQYQARLDQAEARVAKAEAVAQDSARQLERQEKIYNRGLSATRDLEIARRNAARDRAEVEAAQAAVRSARVNLGHTAIRAPLDGVVLERKVEPGETVIANLRPPLLFRVASNLAKLDVVVRMDERHLDRVSEGQRLKVEVPALEKFRASGKVVRVGRAPVTDNGKPGYPVRIRLANGGDKLRPGMTARVFLP